MLDVFTILWLTGLTYLVSSASLWVARRQYQGVQGLPQWTWGTTIMGLAFISFGLSGVLPGPAVPLLGNAAACAGNLIFWDGTRRYLGRPGFSPRTVGIITLGSTVLIGIAGAEAVAGYRGRIGVASLILAIICAGMAREFLSAKPFRASTGVVLGLAAAIEAVVLILRVFSLPSSVGPYDPTRPMEIITFAITLAGIEGLCFGVLLLTGERFQTELQKQASVDPLTGLFNRRAFYKAAEASLGHAQRTGEPLAVMMADLDHFKRVNDQLGHDAGDRLLKTFARVAGEVTRSQDLVARFGGEEFVFLLPDTTVQDAVISAQRLRQEYRRQAAEAVNGSSRGSGQPPVTLTVSVGVAQWPTDEPDVDRAMRLADTAMYAAKTGGRDRVMTSPTTEPENKNSPQDSGH